MLERKTQIIGRVESLINNRRDARVVPLLTRQPERWVGARPIDFPRHGFVLWPDCEGALENDVVVFTVVGNGRRDRYVVDRLVPWLPVLAQPSRRYEDIISSWERAPIAGLTVRLSTDELFLHCWGDRLIGPVPVTRATSKKIRLRNQGELSNVTTYDVGQVVKVSPNQSIVVQPAEPIGALDLRPDHLILKTALSDAAEIYTATAQDHLNAADLLTKAGRLLAANRSSDPVVVARLERALWIVKHQDRLRQLSAELLPAIMKTPAFESVVQDRVKKIAAAAPPCAHEDEIRRLHHTNDELNGDRTSLRARIKDLEDEVASAHELLAEVDSAHPTPIMAGNADLATRSPFSKSGQTAPQTSIKTLRTVAANLEIPATALQRIHASIQGGLLPVVIGAGALATLHAYGRIACAGRVATIPVCHDFLQPHDLLGFRNGDEAPSRAHGDLLRSALNTCTPERPGLLILDSLNRGATESYLLPWLASPDQGIDVPGSRGRVTVNRESLLVAATAISGSTTAPFGADLFTFATIIDVPQVPSANTWNQLASTYLTAGPDKLAKETSVVSISDVREAFPDQWVVDEGIAGAVVRMVNQLSRLGFDGADARRGAAESILLPAFVSNLAGADLFEAISRTTLWLKHIPSIQQDLTGLARRLERTVR